MLKINTFVQSMILIGAGLSLWACTSSDSSNVSSEQVIEDSSNLVATSTEAKPRNQAEKRIDQAIETHGGARYQSAEIEFDFRGRHYVAYQNGGTYRYERHFEDSTGQEVHDVLSNEGFTRTVAGQEVSLTEEWQDRYGNSINSVIYFTLLPFKLNDSAVQARYLGQDTIKGEPYHEIEVTFRPEGGGKDHEDVYLYWIHQQKNTMDYLAYSFDVNEGGTRFREAINRREVEGIVFQDYNNYKGEKETPLAEMDQMLEDGTLEKLSEIINENIEVKLLSN